MCKLVDNPPVSGFGGFGAPAPAVSAAPFGGGFGAGEKGVCKCVFITCIIYLYTYITILEYFLIHNTIFIAENRNENPKN
jgi:hypothetical protein